jgi:hypothetical protein
VASARSIEEIEQWLGAQSWVENVWAEGYILKTNPPRRVLTIIVRQPHGSPQRYQLILVELPDDSHRVWDFRKA